MHSPIRIRSSGRSGCGTFCASSARAGLASSGRETFAWARVAVAQQNGHLSIVVQDNGLGIPKESLPRLFEKFYRVRCDDRKDIIGTGLGLSLVKQIIDVHQGSIRVESEHGKGSTFTFTMPIVKEGMEPMTMTTASVLSAVGVGSN